MGCPAVLRHIVHGFLGDTEDRRFRESGTSCSSIPDLLFDRDMGVGLLVFAAEPVKSRQDSQVVEDRGSQIRHDPPHLLQALCQVRGQIL